MFVSGVDIAAAVSRLRGGGLVAFPTETVYGLGADALSAAAVARVFAVKGRPSGNPLIVHVADAAGAGAVVREWTEEAEKVAAAFWPGPVSIVLAKHERVPGVVTGGGPNVAVRCPDHPVALALLRAFGGPLVGPSANLSGRVSPTRAEHVRESFDERDVMVLDGGDCRAGVESTVISLVGQPRILRLGVVGAAALERVLGKHVEVAAGSDGRGGVMESPGMLASHYAPLARLVVCGAEEVAARVGGAAGVSIVTHMDDIDVEGARVVRLPADAAGYARGLYAALREADVPGTGLILLVRPAVEGAEEERAIWMAVMDRLGRASA